MNWFWVVVGVVCLAFGAVPLLDLGGYVARATKDDPGTPRRFRESPAGVRAGGALFVLIGVVLIVDALV